MFDFCVDVGNQERRVQYKTRLYKRILDKGEITQRTFETIGKWSQERVCFLINMQAFIWASHLKHWILKMKVWPEMVRERVKARKPPR